MVHVNLRVKFMLVKLFTLLGILALAILIFFLFACGSKPSNEMEEMTRDVLKSKQGIEIDVKPIPKEKSAKSIFPHLKIFSIDF